MQGSIEGMEPEGEEDTAHERGTPVSTGEGSLFAQSTELLLSAAESIDEDEGDLLLPSAPIRGSWARSRSEWIKPQGLDVRNNDVVESPRAICVSLPASPQRAAKEKASNSDPSLSAGLLQGFLSRMQSVKNLGLGLGSVWGGNAEDAGKDGANRPRSLSGGRSDRSDGPLSPKTVRKRKLRALLRKGFLQAIKQRKAELDKFTLLASYYAQDAFAGRLKHGLAEMSKKKDDPQLFRYFVIQTSNWWMQVVLWANIAHCALVLFEKPNHTVEWGFQFSWLRLLEVCLITVYIVDAALKWQYMGRKDYMAKPWQACFVYVIGVLLLDALSFCTVRFARPMRPVILCLRGRSVRRFFSVIQEMLPGFIKVCAPLFLFILLFSSFAAMAFGSQQPLFATPASASYNVWILTICTENYSDLLDGDLSKNPLYLAMFFIMLAIGNIFLLSMLLGVTYDVFLAHTKDQVQKERLKELQGLTKAFQTMDPTGKGTIEKVVWDAFLRNLKPELSEKEVTAYFYLATNFADELDVISFLDLRAVLTYYHFNGASAASTESRLQGPIIHFLRHKMWRGFFMVVVLLDLLLLPYDVPTDATYASLHPAAAAASPVVGEAEEFVLSGVGGGVGGGGEEAVREFDFSWPLLVNYASVFCTAVLTAEALLQILARMPKLWKVNWKLVAESLRLKLKMKYSWREIVVDVVKDGYTRAVRYNARFIGSLNEHERFCCAVIVLHLLLEILAVRVGWMTLGDASGGAAKNASGTCDTRNMLVLKALFTLRLLRCWRVVSTNDSLLTYVSSFFQILPIFTQCLGFALIVAYSFAMMAMDLFGARTKLFSEPWAALLTMIQVFFGVQFDQVLASSMEDWGRWALLFFVAYYILGVLIVFNFINAIIIQFYSETLNQKSLETVEKQKLRETHLQEALLRQMTKARVIKAFGGKMTGQAGSGSGLPFPGASAVEEADNAVQGQLVAQEGGATSADLRRSLAIGNQQNKVSTDELRACAKYSNVDLVAIAQRKKEAVNDLEKNLFEQLLLESETTKEGVEHFEEGTYIISMGDMYVPTYFVRSGAVEMCFPDGSKKTVRKGSMFGEMALLADEMPQPADCVVVSPGGAYVLVVHRRHVTQLQNSVENMGKLAMRLNKGGSFLHTPVAIDRARSNSKHSMHLSRGGSYSPRTASSSSKIPSPTPGSYDGFPRQDSVELYSLQPFNSSPGGTHTSYMATPVDYRRARSSETLGQPTGDGASGRQHGGQAYHTGAGEGAGGQHHMYGRPRSPPPSSAPPLALRMRGAADYYQSLATVITEEGSEEGSVGRGLGKSNSSNVSRAAHDDSWAMRKEESSSSVGSSGSAGGAFRKIDKDRPPVYAAPLLPRQGSFGRPRKSSLGDSAGGLGTYTREGGGEAANAPQEEQGDRWRDAQRGGDRGSFLNLDTEHEGLYAKEKSVSPSAASNKVLQKSRKQVSSSSTSTFTSTPSTPSATASPPGVPLSDNHPDALGPAPSSVESLDKQPTDPS